MVLDQGSAIVRIIAQQMAQHVGPETLAEHGSDAERTLVGCRDVVESREDQTLNRIGDSLTRALLQATEQLFKEQRVASGTFNTLLGHVAHRVDECPHHCNRFALVQRSEIHRQDRAIPGTTPPREVNRITFHPRGHHEEGSELSHPRGKHASRTPRNCASSPRRPTNGRCVSVPLSPPDRIRRNTYTATGSANPFTVTGTCTSDSTRFPA